MRLMQLLLAVALVATACVASSLPDFSVPPAHGEVRDVNAQDWLEAAKHRVNTTEGVLEGYVYKGVRTYRGVRYADSPVGKNRFRVPQPPKSWHGTRKAYSEGHICPQFHVTKSLHMGKEDCLFLSVYAPDTADVKGPLPVLVWLHGGAWVLGDGYEFGFYDGTTLARERDAVVVTINYRLNALGFLALDELRSESEDGHSVGNLGLKDQRAALEWVRRNIGRFGGDASRVTLFGESAGAFSVCFHLASKASHGLFHAAIMESGTCDSPFFFTPAAETIAWSKHFLKSVGCDTEKRDVMKCLRGKSAAELTAPDFMRATAAAWQVASQTANTPTGFLGASEGVEYGSIARAVAADHGLPTEQLPVLYPLMCWAATIDESDFGLSDVPIKVIREGRGATVPVVVGSNKDEGSMFVFPMPLIVPGMSFPMQERDLRKLLRHFYGESFPIEEALALYPPKDFLNTNQRCARVIRDYLFSCSSRRLALAREPYSANGNNTHVYHFTYNPGWAEMIVLGTYHASEVAFVFHNQWPAVIHAFKPADHRVANTFGTYWTNLAAFGNVNGPAGRKGVYVRGGDDVIHWPEYSSFNNESILVINDPPQVQQALFGDQCRFWDRLIQ